MNDKKLTLRTARLLADLTQKEAAEKIGVSEDAISNYERGKTFPNVLVLKRIEKAYNVSYNDIVFLPADNG